MTRALAAACLLVLAAGCAAKPRPPEANPPWDGAPAKSETAPPPAAEPAPTEASRPERGGGRRAVPVVGEPATAPEAPVPAVVVIKPEPPAPAPAVAAATPETPGAKSAQTAAKPVAAPAPKTPAPPGEAPPPARPAARSLDLAALEKRLKDTNAIGVFTKLTLKNQVDDLLNQFRAFYQGRSKTTLAALRQPYDLLILKVLTLLQDGDPSLARAVADSREAIWGILSDPDRFKNL